MNYDFKNIPNPNFDSSKPESIDNYREIVDPLCEASKWWCENHTLNILKLSFMDESAVKQEYISGFKATLSQLKNYIDNHISQDFSQHYFDELASYQADVKEYFPCNNEYQKMLNESLYSVDIPINFKKLEKEFSELNFKEPSVDINKNRLFNKALRLIAYHQVAPPQWLADEMLNRFEVNSHKNTFNMNEEEFNKQMKMINSRPSNQSLERTAEIMHTDKSKLDKMIKYDKLQKQKLMLGLSYLP